MKKYKVNDFTNGWIIGNFFPTIYKNKEFEIAIKTYNQGEKEVKHFQRIATEVTFVVCGKIRMNNEILKENEIILIDPLEEFDFEAISKSTVVCIKFPSMPSDKIISD